MPKKKALTSADPFRREWSEAGRVCSRDYATELRATGANSKSRPFENTVGVCNRMKRGLQKPFLRWLVSSSSVLCVLICWYAATEGLHLLRPIQFPSPPDVYASLVRITEHGYAGGTLVDHVLASTKLILLGFSLAIMTGVPLGLLMGRSRAADSYLNAIFQTIRPIAPIAWIPLTIIWFGLGDSAKLFVIWLAAFAPALINTSTGAKNISATLVAAARAHGATRRWLLTEVVIPGALPSIFTGLRISLQACWMVLVAAELVGSFAGLGHVMIIATRDLDPGMIMVSMACIAALGVLFSSLLTLLERLMIPWRN